MHKVSNNHDQLLDRSLEQFSWILASIWEPRWSPKPPSWSQDRPKTPQSWRQDRLKTSTWSQDGPKTLPRHLQGPILKDFGLHLGWFFNHFRRILMIIFVVFFHSFWHPLCFHFAYTFMSQAGSSYYSLPIEQDRKGRGAAVTCRRLFNIYIYIYVCVCI